MTKNPVRRGLRAAATTTLALALGVGLAPSSWAGTDDATDATSAAGKTVADIATILGLTPATVEKHLRLARHATGADTTAHAIMRAYLDHQIFPHDQNENPFAF